jgi:hypothetical protein
MGKRVIIKGADFSANGIKIPNVMDLTGSDCTVEQCGLYALTGQLTDDPTTYAAWSTSDFINIESASTLKFKKCGNASSFGIAFYSSSETSDYISGVVYNTNLVGTTISVPHTAKYLRFCCYTGWEVELELK